MRQSALSTNTVMWETRIYNIFFFSPQNATFAGKTLKAQRMEINGRAWTETWRRIRLFQSKHQCSASASGPAKLEVSRKKQTKVFYLSSVSFSRYSVRCMRVVSLLGDNLEYLCVMLFTSLSGEWPRWSSFTHFHVRLTCSSPPWQNPARTELQRWRGTTRTRSVSTHPLRICVQDSMLPNVSRCGRGECVVF